MIGSTDLEESADSLGSRNDEGVGQKTDKIPQDVNIRDDSENSPVRQDTEPASREPANGEDNTVNKTPSTKMRRLVLDSSSDEEDMVISRKQQQNMDDSDGEDVNPSIRKTPKNRRKAVLEDSDEEDSSPPTGEGSTVQQSAAGGANSDSSDGEDLETKRIVKKSSNKKKRIVMEDSSDQDEGLGSLASSKIKKDGQPKSGKMNILADSSDDEDMLGERSPKVKGHDKDQSKEGADVKTSKDGKKKRPVLDSSSDEEVEMHLNKLNSDLFDDEQNDNSDQSEERDMEREEEDRSKKSAKSKGRKKQEKPPRPKRLSKTEQHLMHSETQRMTRESGLKLPYLKPAPKTIDDFFKPRPKAGPLKAVGGIASLLRKPVAQQLAVRKTTSQPTRLAEKPLSSAQAPSQANPAAPPQPTKADVFTHDELDELPDIVDNSADKEDKDLPNVSTLLTETKDSDLTAVNTNLSTNIISESDIEMQENVETTQGTSKGFTQDSGVETDAAMSTQTAAPLPTNMSDEVSSAQPVLSQATSAEQSEPAAEEQKKEDLKLMVPPPCLSGGPDSFIDLEDSGVSSSDKPKKKGSMVDLLDRFLKHSQPSKKRAKKHQQHISIVKKETTAEGKEELKQETLTVTVEEGEEPAKEVAPGARLMKLKETLQAKMRERRAQEREKREQMYKLDNEEGFGEEEEEEELTDEEDTDDEEQDGEERDQGQGILDLEAEEDGEEEEEDADTILTDELPATTNLKPVKLCPGDSETDSSNVDFKTPAKFARPPHPFSAGSDKTMDLFDSTTSESNLTTPGNSNHSIKSKQDATKGLEVTPTGQSKPGQGKGFFSFSAIKQKKGLIRHESQGFPFDDSDQSQDGSAKDSKRQADTSSVDLNTSMDLGTSIPSHQPEKKVGLSREDTAPDLFAPFSRFKSGEEPDSGQKSSIKLSELTLPIEDSQDLYRSSQSPPPGQRLLSTQSFNFSLESDSQQSQLLDSDGFLKAADEKRPPKRQLLLADDNAMDTNMDELLDLCSGRFTGRTQNSDGSQRDRKAPDVSRGFASDGFKARLPRTDSQDDMDELLGLCSGTFTDSTQQPAQATQGRKRPREESQDGSSMSLRMVSDEELEEEEEKTERKYFSDEEEEDKEETEDVADGDDADGEEEEEDEEEKEGNLDDGSNEELDFHRHFKGFMYKKKRKIRAAFVEQEAELSGSEAGSGDEVEGSDLDEYEHDTDPEDLPSDEEELQKQVHRLHMKSMLDEDKRKLRLYQEAYLEDGDLHSDSRRKRRFRWTNTDENSQTDLFTLNSDGEQEGGEEGEDDSQWRMARYQREKWLREKQESQHDSDDDHLDENSQFVKTAKKALSKMKKPALPSSPSKENEAKKTNTAAVSPGKPPILGKPMRYRYGSFLKKDKASLERLASVKVVDPNGPRHSKNFIFKRVSPDKPKPAAKRPQVSRSISQVVTPSAKRPRLDRSQSEDSNSIFTMLY
ncbi:CLSPN [Branchiostoma lanceolatum]|uniref:CLSPN protein n=2 Tax=Branchiostoma lanceolatum TaxID=7740 RepID=A0A8K0ENK3_BRALA|nr:CLSPN [Branchiostoma lanceolatum]